MINREKSVGQEGERPDSERNDVVRLNEDLGLLETSLRKYIDERFGNLPEFLLPTPGTAKTSEDPLMRTADRWIWRFDVYLVVALLLLSFLVWRTWPGPASPDEEKMAGPKVDAGTAESPGTQRTEEKTTAGPAAEKSSDKSAGENVTENEAETKDASAGEATKDETEVEKVEEKLEQETDGSSVGEKEEESTSTIIATATVTPVESLINSDAAGSEGYGRFNELWKKLADLGRIAYQHRNDFYFLVLSGLLGAVLWKLSLVSRSSPVPTESQSLGLVWYFKKGRHYKPWKEFVRKEPQKVAWWLNKLSLGEGLSPDQLDFQWENDVLRWREAVEQKRDLGGADMEACVRLLFQYFYARWVSEHPPVTADGAPGFNAPQVSGQPGAVPREGLQGLARNLLLGAEGDRLDPGDPRAQVAIVVKWLRLRAQESQIARA